MKKIIEIFMIQEVSKGKREHATSAGAKQWPDGMDGHHQWYTADILLVQSNKEAMGWFCQGNKAKHVCHFLQICCLLYV